MAITYPGTLDTFVNPTGTSTLDSPDHALQHSNVNDAIEAVQAVVGTTAGTAVLMDFTAGQFPIKQEGGALVETITGGTINATTLGTPTVTGGSFASPTTTGTDAGTATLTNKTLTSPVIQVYDGWIDANETWEYASASTITVPSGAASRYQKGDRIKWTQTTVKYGVIVAVADTVLTIAVNTDYVVTNATITLNYYSHEANPVGYPGTFSWATSWGGFSTNPTGTWKYAIIGNLCTMQYAVATVGTSNATSFTFTVPVASSRAITGIYTWGQNNGSLVGDCAVNSSGSTFNCLTSIAGATWTASGAKEIYLTTFTYEF